MNQQPVQPAATVTQSIPTAVCSSAPPASANPHASPEAFGLHQGSGILLAIFDEIQRCIEGSGVTIHSIDHKQYQEAYVFCMGPDTASIRIAYNGKQKVSSIQPAQNSVLSNWLMENQSNGWKVKADLTQLQQQPWFDVSVEIAALKGFLKQQAEGALDILLGPSRTACGLVVYLHGSGKGLNLYLSEKQRTPVPLRLIKDRKKPQIGDYLLVTMAGEGDEETSVIAAEITAPQKVPDVETYTDELSVNDKGFGFVGRDTFVPPSLIGEGMDRQRVEALRYRSFDKKKGQFGWKALLLKPCGA